MVFQNQLLACLKSCATKARALAAATAFFISFSAFSSTTPAATLATLQLQLASFSASEARPQAPSSFIVVKTVAFCLWILSENALRENAHLRAEALAAEVDHGGERALARVECCRRRR